MGGLSSSICLWFLLKSVFLLDIFFNSLVLRDVKKKKKKKKNGDEVDATR